MPPSMLGSKPWRIKTSEQETREERSPRLPLVLLLAWQRVDLRRTFGLRWPEAVTGGRSGAVWRTIVSVAGAMLVGGGLFVLGAAVLLAVRGTHVSAEAKGLAEKLIGMMRDKPIWLSWSLIALLPAIGEELLFRGWVQSAFIGSWPSRWRVVAGVLAQAACFAVFHLLPERMPQTFALGIVTGGLTLATRSLLPAIACHAAHNSMPLVMLWLAGGLSGSAELVSTATAAATGLNLSAATVVAALASVAVGTAMIWLAVWGRTPARLVGRRVGSVLAGIVAVGGAVCAGPGAGAEDLAPPAAAVAPQRLRVGVVATSAAVDWKGDHPSGVMIDVWNDLARRLDGETDFIHVETFKHLMEMLPAGELDVALGPIAITEERERFFDLTHPVFHSGLRVAVRQRNESGFLTAMTSLLSWDLLRLLGVVLVLAIASGHLLWWFERRGNPESFPPQYPRGVWEAI